MQFMVAPRRWSPEQPNPFSNDGSYEHGWSCFELTRNAEYRLFTVRTKSGCWLAKFGSSETDLGQRLVDFVAYENDHRRTPILDFPTDIDATAFFTQALENALGPSELRHSDPDYVVHSTTMVSWDSVRQNCLLKAASLTDVRPRSTRNQPHNETEAYLAGEPPEYRDYVMFGPMGPGPEIVVASYAAGHFQLDYDSPYTPGARLYFNNKRIVADGRCTRDGIHQTKVLGALPLEGYLLFVVTAEELANGLQQVHWTPRSFSKLADERFEQHMARKESV